MKNMQLVVDLAIKLVAIAILIVVAYKLNLIMEVM